MFPVMYRQPTSSALGSAAQVRGPNFFILGAPKCGTTAMAHWLSTNPAVYMSPVKEPHYYSNFHNRYTSDKRIYLGLFENATSAHLAIGEASVWYLYSPHAVARILEDIPDAKFIVCLRNPVKMAYSLHGQCLRDGDETIWNFRTAWQAQALRAHGKKIPRTCRDSRILLYGPACRLGEQLSRLLKLVPRERVKPVFLDDVRDDPGRCYREVLRFLGVPDDGRMKFDVVNRAYLRHYPRAQIAIGRLQHIRKKCHLPRTYLGMAFSPFKRWNITPDTRPPLEEDMQIVLRKYFMQDICELEYLLERNLDTWKDDVH